MELLLTLDRGDYTEGMPVVERHGVRAIILQGDKLAVQCGRKGDFKLPGGGVDKGETHEQTLLREVREELGLLVLPQTIRPLGEILELREDLLCPGKKYVAHNYYYSCAVEPRRVAVSPTPSELAKGYQPGWHTLREVYEQNLTALDEPWTLRDNAFLELLLSGRVIV